MSNPQVFYEAKLSREGRKLTLAGSIALVLWLGGGAVLCFRFSSFPENLSPMAIFAVGALCLALPLFRVNRLRSNPGFYRISIDDYGLYVHSDDPGSAPPFNIIAPDVHRLVRKTISHSETTDVEYYVETKSGTRHRIEQLFSDYDLDVMKMFEKIIDRFPWVQVLEEVK